jgi:pimeloyl-ACP methyl ester carboxylesterase
VRRVAAAAALALALLGAGAPVSPAYPGCIAAPGPDLRFRAADGTRLVGHRFGRGATAVVLVHEYGGDVCQWAPYGRRLASLGYTTLAFDLRGFGESQRREGNASLRYAGDIAAAVKTARSLGAKHVIVVGASIGANATVVAGANVRPPLDGIVSLSAPGTFRLDAIAAAANLAVPVLYAAAAVDEGGTYAKDAKAMYDATPIADKQIAVVPGAAHGVRLGAGPGKVRTLVESFIRAHAH